LRSAQTPAPQSGVAPAAGGLAMPGGAMDGAVTVPAAAKADRRGLRSAQTPMPRSGIHAGLRR
jgi:hypothetical protein